MILASPLDDKFTHSELARIVYEIQAALWGTSEQQEWREEQAVNFFHLNVTTVEAVEKILNDAGLGPK